MLGIYARTSKDINEEQSTIEQQIKAGVDFANNFKLDYKIYQDKNISGYKIKDDDDPITNRPSMKQLINDIKDGQIDTVWVWEHSRLSRNTYTSAYIFNIFAKHNVELYEKNKKFDFNDPANTFMRQIMDAVAEYERNMIVGRTTRGLYNAIDSGKRTYCQFFGYKPAGRNEQGYRIWLPVESDLKQVEIAYKKFFAGVPMIKIVKEWAGNDLELQHRIRAKLGKYLRHYEYTGMVLTMEGLEILKKFDTFEIDSVKELLDKKYWVKHQFYTRQLITIEEWVKVAEMLQPHRKRKREIMAKRASKESLGTGLLKCTECGMYYYYTETPYKWKNIDKVTINKFYYHFKLIGNNECKNRKAIKVDNFDVILDIFYINFLLYFDTSKIHYQAALERNKTDMDIYGTKVKEQNNEIKRIESQIEKFEKALEKSDDTEAITTIAKQISKKEKELEEAQDFLELMKEEFRKAKGLYKESEFKISMYSLRDEILNYFNSTPNRKREKLLDYEYFMHKEIIIIIANDTIFIFGRTMKYTFDNTLLQMIKDNEEFKDFTEESEIDGYGMPVCFDFQFVTGYASCLFESGVVLKEYLQERKNINAVVLEYVDKKDGKTYQMFFDKRKANKSDLKAQGL